MAENPGGAAFPCVRGQRAILEWIAPQEKGEPMKPLVAIVVCAVLWCTGALHPRPVAAAVCGDGILDPNEECDPGGGLHHFGDPSQETCGFGGSSIPGSECFFDFTCCKFN